MTVARILAGKGRDVVTIAPDHTLADAVALLTRKGIGAVVITGPGHSVLGILSERDVVRALAQTGPAVLDQPVSGHMTTRVVTATDAMSLDRLTTHMTEGRFRHVPVVEDGALVGLVSIGDVVKLRLADMEGEHAALREYIATA